MRSIARRTCLLGLLVAVLSTAACDPGPGTGLLVLSITADSTVPPGSANTVAFSMQNQAPRIYTGLFPPADHKPLVLEFPSLPASSSPVPVTVQALNSNCLVATATRNLAIQGGKRTTAEIVLARSAEGCGVGDAGTSNRVDAGKDTPGRDGRETGGTSEAGSRTDLDRSFDGTDDTPLPLGDASDVPMVVDGGPDGPAAPEVGISSTGGQSGGGGSGGSTADVLDGGGGALTGGAANRGGTTLTGTGGGSGGNTPGTGGRSTSTSVDAGRGGAGSGGIVSATGGTATGGAGGATGGSNGAQIYVSPSGDDTNDGTIDHPLRTLTAARDLADQRKTSAPVTVYLRGGTYYLSAPVEFGSANSGTPGAPVVYAAYGSEKPVISGGIRVTSTWTTSSGAIKVATIAANLKVDQLFLNGRRQILARYPDYDSSKPLDGYAADSISSSRVSRWADPAEGPGYFRALHSTQWGGNSFVVTGKSGTTLSRTWVGDNNRGSGTHATYRMIENIFEELDAPGEWFYRKATGELFFNPPPGTDLDSATIELASQDELLRIVGTGAARVRHITFRGLTFTHTYRTLFSKPYEFLLRGDWAIARAGAVYVANAENIQIDSCTFDQIGGNGIFVSGYNRDHAVTNNRFEDAGATCVAIVGLQSAVRCAATSFDDATTVCADRSPGPRTEDYPARVLVENNTMVNFGRFEKQVAGVHLSMTRNDTVRHNTIHRMPGAGISFNDGCWGGHVIEWNWVYDPERESGERGPIMAWGRDRSFYWQNDVLASKFDAVDTTTIQNNRLETTPPRFGINLDDQATNYLQKNNLCIGGGLKVQWSRFNTYENNVLVGGAVIDIHNPWAESNHSILHNIVVGDFAYSFFAVTDLSALKTNVPNIAANLFYNSGQDPKMCQWAATRPPAPFTWTQWRDAGFDANSVVADPMFVNPGAGDYSVQAGSPALSVGFKNFPMTGFGATTGP